MAQKKVVQLNSTFRRRQKKLKEKKRLMYLGVPQGVECVMVGGRCAPGGAPGRRFANTGQRAPSPCPDTRAHCSREAAARAAERLRLWRPETARRPAEAPPSPSAPSSEGRPGTHTRASREPGALSLSSLLSRASERASMWSGGPHRVREIALADLCPCLLFLLQIWLTGFAEWSHNSERRPKQTNNVDVWFNCSHSLCGRFNWFTKSYFSLVKTLYHVQKSNNLNFNVSISIFFAKNYVS